MVGVGDMGSTNETILANQRASINDLLRTLKVGDRIDSNE